MKSEYVFSQFQHTHTQTMVQLEEDVSAWEGKWFELLRTTQTNVLLLNVSPKQKIIPTNTDMHLLLQPWWGGVGVRGE